MFEKILEQYEGKRNPFYIRKDFEPTHDKCVKLLDELCESTGEPWGFIRNEFFQRIRMVHLGAGFVVGLVGGGAVYSIIKFVRKKTH